MSEKKLVITGFGIKFLSHLTTESKAYISKADKVLYLVNEPLTKEWIKKNTCQHEELDNIYFSHEKRVDSYKAITKKIIDELNVYDFVCVVIYGHPSVFAQPGLDAAIKTSAELNIETIILPAISAVDCLYADLMVDPGEQGCFSVDATELLLFDKVFDPTCHLVLWQLGMIGNLGLPSEDVSLENLNLLVDKLLESYEPDHVVKLYEAAMYPGMEPTISTFSLKDLSEQRINNISTLYVPPRKPKGINMQVLYSMGLGLDDIYYLKN